jgi:hypothetical protein
MMDKLSLFKTVTLSVIICLLLSDGLRLMAYPAHTLSQPHKDILLTAALLWIASAFINQRSNDDDWAGQL